MSRNRRLAMATCRRARLAYILDNERATVCITHWSRRRADWRWAEEEGANGLGARPLPARLGCEALVGAGRHRESPLLAAPFSNSCRRGQHWRRASPHDIRQGWARGKPRGILWCVADGRPPVVSDGEVGRCMVGFGVGTIQAIGPSLTCSTTTSTMWPPQ